MKEEPVDDDIKGAVGADSATKMHSQGVVQEMHECRSSRVGGVTVVLWVASVIVLGFVAVAASLR